MKYALAALAVIPGAVLLYIALLAVSALFVDGKRVYATNSRYYRFLLESSTACAFFIMRVKIHVTGFERVPRDARFLFVSNHRSNFDPLVTWHVLRGLDVAFISKPENFNVPVFGRLIRRCGFLPIDRSSPRSSMETLNKAAEMMRDDVVSFGIYPEGTRSKTCELLPLHNGIFTVAHKASVPVVVATLRGTEQIHKRYIRRRTDVYFDVVDVIPASDAKSMRTNDIGARVASDFQNNLQR
ncbi:MAG: 1-acyl-sn-glycerol-3-phosphate acyltransferase [Clostridia bacterium]|nr:1-acyl-sn-glycerol-3-phosphate acyltransferase [Clostridia bacterium]